ncbi:hypothetical protein [Amycolatopsis suaedae]|uniref:Uncharacterized protein n=1 Tax=Amycolatopsis suaedae TaxID=2510978 RepID=A0A4Q7JAD6_9PSEU|nr:hypothetical protein [Amycolatopsis suaedae]RZQ63433.1 hypothetical protein EWH70_13405 [Amycolatopsis suaedae]
MLPLIQLGQSAQASDPRLFPAEPRRNGTLPPALVGWACVFVGAAVLHAVAQASQPVAQWPPLSPPPAS